MENCMKVSSMFKYAQPAQPAVGVINRVPEEKKHLLGKLIVLEEARWHESYFILLVDPNGYISYPVEDWDTIYVRLLELKEEG